MKNRTYLLALSILLLNSCASILNGDYMTIDIHTTEPATIIYEKDTLQTEQNKVILSLERSRNDIDIIAQTDSVSKSITLRSKLSPAFYMNFLWIYGMLVDRNDSKVFGYPQSIQLDMSNSIPIYYSYGIPEKGQFYYNLSFPVINNFLVNPYTWSPVKTGTGYVGIGAGLEYYYQKDKFINATFSIAGTVYRARRDDGNELFSMAHFSLSHNHRKPRWSYGYGLSFGRTYWDKNLNIIDDFGMPNTTLLYKDSKNWGLIFSGQYQLTERFYVNLIYRPSLLEVEPVVQGKYEHLVSFEFLWKIRTRR